MREPWRELLDPQIHHDRFGFTGSAELERAAADGGLVAPLPRLGLLHVAGDDAATFLHNQLTQSVNDLPADRSRLAAWCTAKGRALAVFRVLQTDTGLLLLADRDIIEAALPRLRMFVLRARVALTDLSDGEGVMGLAGPAAETLLAEAAGSPPAEADGVIRAGDLHVVRLRGEPPVRYLLTAPATQLGALWQRFSQALTPADEGFWELLDIRAGLPDVRPQTRERFVPPMLNLEPLGGIHYAKGCYPGQEVVARMRYLGRLKRRMVRLETSGEPPAPGTGIRTAAGRDAGEVVNAAARPTGGCELLAVLRIEAEQEDLLVDGLPATPLPLPYPLPGGSQSGAGGDRE